MMIKGARFSTVRSRGFTIIELMLVVLIIAILSSIAVPEFLNMSIRAKKSERDMAMRNIAAAVEEVVSQNDKLPTDLGGGASYLWCPDNPPPPYTGMKKQWVPGQPGWTSLTWEPTGYVYFHYYVYGYLSPSFAYFYVLANSDLNGNGIPAFRRTWYTRDATGGWNITDDIELPVGES